MLDKKYVCMFCGDEFTEDDLAELKEMGESYFVDRKEKSFICPDCYDDLNRKDPEEQVQILVNQYGNGSTFINNVGNLTINID